MCLDYMRSITTAPERTCRWRRTLPYPESRPGRRQHSSPADPRRIAPSLRPDVIYDMDTSFLSISLESVALDGQFRRLAKRTSATLRCVSWRHTWKTVALGAGIEERLRDEITGHSVGRTARSAQARPRY